MALHRRKWLAGIMASVLTVSLLAGCGNTESTDSGTQDAAAGQEAEDVAGQAPDDAGSDETVVQTASGQLRGSEENGIYQYLGVPYAEAKERFVRAEAVEPWDGIRDAMEYGSISPQGAFWAFRKTTRERARTTTART